MNSTNVIVRDLQVDDAIVNFIVDNMPHSGYATVATKLGHDQRRTIRDEVIYRKKLYNEQIINTCLEVIEFVTGKKPAVVEA